jgi:hypothetical protein
MRTTKELLQIMLANINKLKGGLCGLVWTLRNDRIFDSNEEIRMLSYIDTHRPINYSYFLRYSYYWRKEKSKPRIRWLKKQIKKQ